MNKKREKYYEKEGKVSQRFSRGLKAFGRRYFSYGRRSYWKKRKYDRELRHSSPALQFVWIIVLIILLVTIKNENKIYILYIFVPIYFLLLIWEIWLMGAPAKERKLD